jgi:cell fate regulator YaaT (PSP1 superfamily)
MVMTEPENKNVVGVRFQKAGKVYYFDPADNELDINDDVIVETERGHAMGRVVLAPKQIIASEITEPLKAVVRKATEEDIQLREEIEQKEDEALAKCKEMVEKLDLPMKLLNAEGNLDGSHFTILFSAEGRVDFRRLVRELASELKARVELHQVGPRDEAKIIGGVGRCGFPLCCGSFLTEFNPLSIKMAKEQNLSLDPTKISGLCGRLLCCLSYETELYRQMKDKLPPIGQAVVTPLGDASVTGVNPIKESVMVQLESQAIVEVPLTDITIKKRSAKREKKQN